MRYRTYIRKRKSRGRQEWLARLIWEDLATQESGEMGFHLSDSRYEEFKP